MRLEGKVNGDTAERNDAILRESCQSVYLVSENTYIVVIFAANRQSTAALRTDANGGNRAAGKTDGCFRTHEHSVESAENSGDGGAIVLREPGYQYLCKIIHKLMSLARSTELQH